MSKYIDMTELPAFKYPGRPPVWPYGEWEAIPEGQALEITDLLNGRKVTNVASHLSRHFGGHDLGLKVSTWNGRLWVGRPKKP